MRRISSTVAAFWLAVAVFWTPTAEADSCDVNRDILTCGSFRATSLDVDFFDWVGQGWLQSDDYGSCGVGGRDQAQDVWIFTCPFEQTVKIEAINLECDMDLMLLRNGCNGNVNCVQASTSGGNSPESVEINPCVPGDIYYVVIERVDSNFWWPFEDCTRWEDFDYSVRVTCYENCFDEVDNDNDGLIDCRDPECPACVEICSNEKDDDFDGLIDCADPDCRTSAYCCDRDGDGFIAATPECGGDDCNDNDLQINPVQNEQPADLVDSNCDGLELCYIDEDGDTWPIDALRETPNIACAGGGVARLPNPPVGVQPFDCDDLNPDVHPTAIEIPINGLDDDCNGYEQCYRDADNDDYGSTEFFDSVDFTCQAPGVADNADDCDDTDKNVYPGATEYPVSGKDEDCNGLEICYKDADGDGFGDPNTLIESTFTDCMAPGVSPNGLDCDDRPGIGIDIFPGADEVVADGVDSDCNTTETCWFDKDDDTFGNTDGRTIESAQLDCDDVQASPVDSDCDDDDPTIYPGAPDPQGDAIDQDCDGLNDCFADLDGDGFGGPTFVPSAAPGCVGVGVSPNNDDCDDNPQTGAAINPNAAEIPNNGIDENCDLFEACYRDVDLDGFGRDDIKLTTDFTCTTEVGVSDRNDDCNDVLPEGAFIYPGATEVPLDGFDNDCNGYELCIKDADADGFGNMAGTLEPSTDRTCSSGGVSTNQLDCNDNDFRIKPGATETIANGVDQDCDMLEDCYLDADGDTYGIDTIVQSSTLTCLASGYSRNKTDCDDTNPDVYPGATPPPGAPGGIDYDCSGFTTCYIDIDGDGYGRNQTIASSDPRCIAPQGGQTISPTNDDCDDNDFNIHPGATELPNDEVDQDCDTFEICYQDLDHDGFGSSNTQLSADITCNADGVSKNQLDCNDNPNVGGADIYPNAPEIPADGVDQSCDLKEACYEDADNDEYGKNVIVLTVDLTCKAGGFVNGKPYTDNNEDCNDGVASINPGRPEIIANGTDENCDNVDQCYIDGDGDGFGRAETMPSPYGLSCAGAGVSQRGDDCLDIPPEGAAVYPGATEIAGNGIDDNCDTLEACYKDLDLDGWGGTLTQTSTDLRCSLSGLSPETGDCNDDPSTGAGINPGATEIPADGIDQDCNNLEDCYRDADRDEYGSASIVPSSDISCLADGVADNPDDCFDVPPLGGTVYPGAPEITGDGIDQDCDGFENCFVDADRDSYGGGTFAPTNATDCTAPGFSTRSDDCNDDPQNGGAGIHPDANEVPADGIDQDCDMLEACYRDRDSDTFGSTVITLDADFTCRRVGISPNDDDCDDDPATGQNVYPGATEIPGDGIDQDCDENDSCWEDLDDDGYGGPNLAAVTIEVGCNGAFKSPIGGDCNDNDPDINPAAADEPANGVDENCDNADDCYRDNDGDGFGSDVILVGNDMTCVDPNESDNSDDCLDAGTINGVVSSDINPDAEEVCNEVDDDCDGFVDDDDADVNATAYSWYPDYDDDGYGNLLDLVYACAPPTDDYTDRPGDCNDSDPNINPGVPEICDDEDVDENCNTRADDDDIDPSTGEILAEGTVLVHPDADGDDYGSDDPLLSIETCDPPQGYVEDFTDCDDTNRDVNPGLVEIPYDGADNDCDPSTLDDDLDGDGFPIATDCNDNPTGGFAVNPNASEVPDGMDNDCNGKVDDGTIWGDDDGDGFTEAGGDCRDNNASIHPGATEQANSLDDDCDGEVDEDTVRSDDDGDGYTENQGDCNDYDPNVNPGQNEISDNGVDDDCDGEVDDGTYDPDGDGYTDIGGDCDQTTGSGGQPPHPGATVYPGAPELPDGKDNDCDGTIDEGTVNYDDDGDGFSESGPAGQRDCNDDDEDVYPGRPEEQNGVDDDCDGLIDEGTDNSDDDGDGFAEVEGDCDDDDDTRYPGADELDNGVDDDCDGEVDEGLGDADGDGVTVEEGDCDDTEGWVNPGLDEICGDNLDNNCDGLTDDEDEDACPTVKPGGTGGGNCSQVGGSPAGIGFVMFALGLVGLRRRRTVA